MSLRLGKASFWNKFRRSIVSQPQWSHSAKVGVGGFLISRYRKLMLGGRPFIQLDNVRGRDRLAVF